MGPDPDARQLDDYAVKLIKHRARQLIGRAGFTEDDRPDIEQDLTLDLLRRLEKFDPSRASLRTFIARVVEHGAATMIEHQEAGIRDYRLQAGSLDDPVGDGDEGQVERRELIDEGTYLRSMGRPAMPLEDEIGLKVSLERLLATLPPELQELYARLEDGQSITDISRATGVPRGTLYERMKELRKLAEDAGLAEYL